MSFTYPGLLFLLLIPTALLVWVWRRSDRRIVLPFDHGRRGSGRTWRILLNLAESVPALLLAIAVIILAGPQRFSEPKTRRALTNIELCVDVSGSMLAPFGGGTRYDGSMKAIDEFLDYRKGDAVGLTFFGNNVLHWVPLTTDSSAIRCAPPFMKPDMAPPWMMGTEIGKALRSCKNVLQARPEGDRMIVLISDGESADLFNDNEMPLAKELKENRIVVYTVHVGEGNIPGEVVNIAALTGGEAFSSDDPEGMKSVLRRIDQMQQTKLEKTLAEPQDHYFPWCVAGLSILGMGMLTLYGARYTPW